MKQKSSPLAVVKVLPTFLFLSVLACLVGRLLFKVPVDELGTVASVPLVIGFVVTRFLVLIVPATRAERPRSVTIAISAIFSFSLLLGAVFAFSSIPYFAIGLPNYGRGSLMAAAFLLGLCVVLLAGVIGEGLYRRASLTQFLRIVSIRAVEAFWDMLRIPTDLSWRIYGHHLDSI